MKDKFSCDQCDYVPTQRNSNSKKSHFLKEKGAAKSRFLDSGVAVTPPPMDQMTSNFACKDLLGGTFDFCISQGCLQRANLFWPPSVIGLYIGHVTLT